jgi:hypothetical protein
MNEASLLRFCDAQTKLIIDLIFDHAGEADASSVPARLDPILPHLIEYCETGKHALEVLGLALLSNQITKTEPISLVVRESVPRMISLLERVRRLGRQARAEGIPPTGLDEYEKAVNRFRKSAIDFLMHWPWGSMEPWEKSAAAAYERGEFREAREALNELLEQARQREQANDRVTEPAMAPPRSDRGIELE